MKAIKSEISVSRGYIVIQIQIPIESISDILEDDILNAPHTSLFVSKFVFHKESERILEYIRRKKHIHRRVLARHFGYRANNKRFSGLISYLEDAGKIETQQSGYKADSLHHHKIIVIKTVS